MRKTKRTWPRRSISDLIARKVLYIGDGYRAKNAEMGPVGLPFARAGNINGGFHFQGADLLDESNVRKAGNKLSQPADIVFTSKGTVGRFAFVRLDTPRFVYSPQLCFWRVLDQLVIDARFLFSWVHGPEFLDQVHSVKGLTDMADYVSLSDQRRMHITLPPLEEQKRIASVLSAYDDLIENNTRRIKILEEMAQMLYREWFVHFRFPGHEKVRTVESELGPIPEGWTVKCVKDVSSYINRGISPKYDDDADGWVLNQKCIRDHRLNLGPSRRQSKPVPSEKVVRKGDILINSTGIGTLGRVAQVHRELKNFTVDSHVTIVRPAKHSDYLGELAIELEPQFEAAGVGSTGQTELGRERIAGTQFVCPPAELQARYSEHAAALHQLSTRLLQKNENLRTTRDLLLPKLISGEIPVPPADDIAAAIEEEIALHA